MASPPLSLCRATPVRFDSLPGSATPERQAGQEDQRRWQPDPTELAPHHDQTAPTDEPVDRDRRDHDRSPSEKVAGFGERGEERYSQAAVCHGVEKPVRGGGQEEKRP